MRFLDSNDYINQLSIDCVIFGYKDKKLKVLVPKLDMKPDFWALPGGFIKYDEGIDKAALRILEERTTIKDIYLEQFRVFGQENRINSEILDSISNENIGNIDKLITDDKYVNWFNKRFISIGYYALVDINKVHPQKTEFDESVDWYDIKNIPKLIMDHNEIVERALETLRLNIDNKLIGFNLLPETFTMKDLQELYEAVYAKEFARNNFQKKVLDLNVLERLEKKFTGASNKAPYLYKFKG